jgi:hypothetical protein
MLYEIFDFLIFFKSSLNLIKEMNLIKDMNTYNYDYFKTFY